MPAEFAGGEWEQFEPATIDIFARWVRQHPGGLVLDVGSSLGIFSAVALFADPSVEVVAFDSDLASIAATRRMCEHASGRRLRLVHGFLGQTPTESKSLASAVAATKATLVQTGVRGDVGTTRFVCLTDPDVGSIPCRRLDDLFSAEVVERRPLLIKCDVEGAELLVLCGAENLLRSARPDLLLSIHPPALPGYGHSREGVREFLEGTGYEIRCVEVDHEEHWWCEFKQKGMG
jgi:FkbM family methyltransferase